MKFLVEKLSTSEVISQKTHEGVENMPQTNAFRVNPIRAGIFGEHVSRGSPRRSSFLCL